jgi:GNAT superfamily N-acetyltransferase
MIKFGVEGFDQARLEIEDLLKLHYEEIALNKEHIPLDPDWDRYRNLIETKQAYLLTVRDDDKLIGYSIFFVTKHLHYKSSIFASNDLIFLHPNYRKGMVGVRLIQFCEQYLKEIGVAKILWHVKFNKDFTRILHHMGYVDEDMIVGKIIKD